VFERLIAFSEILSFLGVNFEFYFFLIVLHPSKTNAVKLKPARILPMTYMNPFSLRLASSSKF